MRSVGLGGAGEADGRPHMGGGGRARSPSPRIDWWWDRPVYLDPDLIPPRERNGERKAAEELS